MDIENFNVLYYKDRELMQDVIEHWEYFTIETIRDAVETLKDRIDIIFWWEDMAEKHGPRVSPKIFKEFFLPHYKNVTSFLKNKIDRVLVDSDGNLNPTLNLFAEAGITGLWPLEVKLRHERNIDIRKKYGNKFFLIGNLDKRELAKGGESMRREIDSKLPVLKELGGYIPGVDHLVHVEFTFQKYKEYCDYIKKYLA